ncbi:ATP synthase F0 subunit B [Streptomyces sp. NPDC001553]|uniref:DivIVA domain-containing protein n=1 Tax=Streptomyces sp. NPDC001553 TaxID=3154385 RepID=UPI00332B55AB
MTPEDAGIEPHDTAAITAFEDALHEFTEELNRLHIVHGAPTYATVAGASVRPRLTKAGLNELLAGKRFTSLEALLEFVRVVTTPRDMEPAAAAGFRADPATVDDWRRRWQDVKLLQRQAQPGSKRLRATVRQTLDDASQEAETLRGDARAEADRIRASAETEAEQLRARARQDADELLHRARQEATGDHGTPDASEGSPNGRAAGAGSNGRSWRARRDHLLRPALRPVAAATAVAALTLAAILAGDSFTGPSDGCKTGRTQAAEQLVHRAAPPGGVMAAQAGGTMAVQGGGTMRLAAFAHKPEAFIPGPIAPLRGFPGPSVSTSLDPSPDPTPDPSPVRSISPTPSPEPTPSPSPSPSPTPTVPGKPDPCAPRARGR